MFFKYGEKEVDFLKNVCPKMAEVIDTAGMLQRKVEPDLFRALISGVVSQQISIKAAATVFGRLEALAGTLAADEILALDDEEIQGCGLSMRKVGYIKGICEALRQGELDLGRLGEMTDGEIIEHLVQLKGIGVWSAEMLMIFSLQRPDVLSYGDLVIRKGIMKLHGLEQLTKKEFKAYQELYSPYGSVAALYLWDLANDK